MMRTHFALSLPGSSRQPLMQHAMAPRLGRRNTSGDDIEKAMMVDSP